MGRGADRNRMAAVEANVARCAECKQPLYAHPFGQKCRQPYVGEGADGARRSAQIDREEADVDISPEARARLLISAERWLRQANFLWESE